MYKYVNGLAPKPSHQREALLMDQKTSERNNYHARDLNFFSGDKFVRYLIEREWSPLATGVIAYLIYSASIIVITLLIGRFFPNPAYRSLLSDFFWWVMGIGLIPLTWGLYVWTYVAPSQVLTQLELDKILTIKEADFKAAQKILSSRLPLVLALVFGLTLTALNFYQGAIAAPGWWNASLVASLFITVINFVTQFLAFLVILRLLSIYRVFFILLYDVTLKPLHHDHAGGLMPIGRFALASLYPIAFGGSVAAFTEYWLAFVGESEISLIFHFAIALYVIGAPFVFFVPIYAAHRGMLRARAAMIAQISDQFDADLQSAYKNQGGTAQALEKNIKKVVELKKLHEITSSFPVWPLDIGVFRRFVLTIASPLVSFIVPALVTFLFSALGIALE